MYFQHAKRLWGVFTLLILFRCAKGLYLTKVKDIYRKKKLFSTVSYRSLRNIGWSAIFPTRLITEMCVLAYETYALIIRFTVTILEGYTFRKELHGLPKKKRQMLQDWKRRIKFLTAHLSRGKRSCYWTEYFAVTGPSLVKSRSEWQPLT
jgi:hypothetical protein